MTSRYIDGDIVEGLNIFFEENPTATLHSVVPIEPNRAIIIYSH